MLVVFPFVQGGQGKQRPALVIIDTGDSDVILAHVTSQTQHSPFDVRLADWKSAGLLAPSTVRLHKLATIDKSLVRRRLGALTGTVEVTLLRLSRSYVLAGKQEVATAVGSQLEFC